MGSTIPPERWAVFHGKSLPPAVYVHTVLPSVEFVQEKNNKALQQTGKRLGFKFNSDDVYGEEAFYTGG